MECPACRGELLRTSIEGETVDIFSECEGIWFDEHELGPVVRRFVADDKPIGIDASQPTATSERMCPKCGVAMVERVYAYDSNVPLDHCPMCRGIWLDPGELRQIAKYREATPAVRALGEAMLVRYRGDERWRRVRSLLRSRSLSVAAAGICVMLWLVNGGWPVGPLRLNFLGRPVWLIRFLVALGLALACIWLPDVLAQVRGKGYFLWFRATECEPTPADAIAMTGWVLMALAFALATVL